MRFLLYIFILCNSLFASDVDIIKVSSFQAVDSVLLELKGKNMNPLETMICVDIDDTILTGGRNTGKPIQLKDHDVFIYITKCKNAGFKLAFLTSRNENERNTTRDDLAKVSSKDFPL